MATEWITQQEAHVKRVAEHFEAHMHDMHDQLDRARADGIPDRHLMWIAPEIWFYGIPNLWKVGCSQVLGINVATINGIDRPMLARVV